MKIYVLTCGDYDCKYTIGTYSTKENALEASKYRQEEDIDIEEFEVDPPNKGEKYEDCFYVTVSENGIHWSDGKERKTINSLELTDGEYGLSYTDPKISLFTAYGRTKEEAFKKACAGMERKRLSLQK